MFSWHKIFTPQRAEEIREGSESAKLGCVECKEILGASVEEYFAPMRERRSRLMQDLDYVREVLETSARKAAAIAAETMSEVRLKMGIDDPS